MIIVRGTKEDFHEPRDYETNDLTILKCGE